MRFLIGAVIVLALLCMGALFTLSYFSRSIKYQFTTYRVPVHGAIKNMTWVSKVKGRTLCSELTLYKRNFNIDWVVTSSACVDGKDQVDRFLDASYDVWLKEKFDQRRLAQAYSTFKDFAGNQSLLYFSESDQSFDRAMLEDIAERFKGKASGWKIIQPRDFQKK